MLAKSDKALPDLADAFPDLQPDELAAKALAVQKWRSQSSLAGRKLVSTSALQHLWLDTRCSNGDEKPP